MKLTEKMRLCRDRRRRCRGVCARHRRHRRSRRKEEEEAAPAETHAPMLIGASAPVCADEGWREVHLCERLLRVQRTAPRRCRHKACPERRPKAKKPKP